MSCVILLFFPRGHLCPRPFPAAAAAEPPRAGQRTAFFHRCPARPEKRGPERRRHGTRPKRTTARAPERGPRPSLPPGRWGAPGQPITAPQAGTGQGRPRAARPTRGGRNAPNDHTAATGGTAKPHGGRPAVLPGPAPRTALSLAGGAAPPALRAAAKTDRGRPATAHGGPGPTPPGPDNHQPRGPEPGGGRPGQAGQFSCRSIPFGPEDGHKAAARDTPRGDSPGPGRRGGPCGPAWRHGRRGGTAEVGTIVWPGVGWRRERKKREWSKPLPNFVTPPRGTRFAPVPRSSRPHIPHRPALRRPSSP